ncbi:unnamed protein product, partial [Prorocentrum cordatum]
RNLPVRSRGPRGFHHLRLRSAPHARWRQQSSGGGGPPRHRSPRPGLPCSGEGPERLAGGAGAGAHQGQPLASSLPCVPAQVLARGWLVLPGELLPPGPAHPAALDPARAGPGPGRGALRLHSGVGSGLFFAGCRPSPALLCHHDGRLASPHWLDRRAALEAPALADISVAVGEDRRLLQSGGERHPALRRLLAFRALCLDCLPRPRGCGGRISAVGGVGRECRRNSRRAGLDRHHGLLRQALCSPAEDHSSDHGRAFEGHFRGHRGGNERQGVLLGGSLHRAHPRHSAAGAHLHFPPPADGCHSQRDLLQLGPRGIALPLPDLHRPGRGPDARGRLHGAVALHGVARQFRQELQERDAVRARVPCSRGAPAPLPPAAAGAAAARGAPGGPWRPGPRRPGRLVPLAGQRGAGPHRGERSPPQGRADGRRGPGRLREERAAAGPPRGAAPLERLRDPARGRGVRPPGAVDHGGHPPQQHHHGRRRLRGEWYDEVLAACSLKADVLQLGPAGDGTEIGERGVNLSGGQRARVGLARAVFARADVVLLDDPLSAVDPSVSVQLVERCIRGRVLADAGVVLCTHQASVFSLADVLLLLDESGGVRACGRPREVAEACGLTLEAAAP